MPGDHGLAHSGKSENAKRRIAIACQGGGSHAAFCAGLLVGLFQSAPFRKEQLELTALTGTSGGAVCASLAWSGVLRARLNNRTPGKASLNVYDCAVAALCDFWTELSARDPCDMALNLWGQWITRLGVEISPYLYQPAAEPRLRELLDKHLKLADLPLGDARKGRPKLFVGVTDVQNGRGWAIRGKTLTLDDVIASAAVPPLFRAVRTRGTFCWDGLFSRNPPIRELTNLTPRPHEIWVIQINPQQCLEEPMTMPEIIDRRNQLAGNLSLSQELKFIEKINQIVRKCPHLKSSYKPILLRTVELDLHLDYPSKFDRSRDLIAHLMERGKARSGEFFMNRSQWTLADADRYVELL